MKESIKSYDNGDMVDVLGIYENKIELMHYMLEKMRGEINVLKNGFNIDERILASCFHCVEVLEQLSYDNLSYVNDEVEKYKGLYEKEK